MAIIETTISHNDHHPLEGGLKCGHDNLEHVIQRNINVKPVSNKILQNQRKLNSVDNVDPTANSEWNNIRITYNTDDLLLGWTNPSFANWFVTDVIPAAIDFLQKAVNVRPIDGNLTLERKCHSWDGDESDNKCTHISSSYASCGGYAEIEEKYFDEIYDCYESDDDCTYIPSGGGKATDLVLYFVGKQGVSSCNNVYGFSSYCHSNLYDRPIVGFVNLCEQTLLKEGDYFTWEKAVTLVVHETYHVMGFSSTGFAYFRENDEDRTARSPRMGGYDGNGDFSTNFGTITHGTGYKMEYGSDTIQSVYIPGRDKTATFITLPTVIEVARNFYNCSDMIGVELEDFGGADTASSHWEQRILSMEFMIGYISSAAPVSVFSFAVFEDSGWYKMNWEYATIPPYGKNFGCSWYEDKCIINDDLNEEYIPLDDDLYCVTNEKYACAPDYVGKSNCELQSYSSDLPEEYQYFASSGDGEIGGVLGYADYCPMFYHYSNGDCRIQEASHVYSSFGAVISPSSKCNELSSSDNTKQYAICYDTHCAENYLLSSSDSSIDYLDSAIYDNYNQYVATRIRISNSDYNKYEYITCWYDESDEYKDLTYYSYRLRCPVFTDICYNKNPWICNGHGQVNTFSNATDNQCICNPGYFGCDCTLQRTEENLNNNNLIGSTCIDYDIDIDAEAVGAEPDNINIDSVGFVNVTIKIDNNYAFDLTLKTLRLWIAIDVKISEDNVWIQSYQELSSTDNTFSISIGYYDNQNMNDIESEELIRTFDEYLFKNGEFELHSIYNVKTTESKASNKNIICSLLLSLLYILNFLSL